MPQIDERDEKRLPVTLSGVRAGEGPAVEAVIADCGLHTEDITAKILRNPWSSAVGSILQRVR